VAARLGPAEAAQAAALTQAIKDTKNSHDLGPLARGLSAVAPRLEPNEAAQAAAALTQAMSGTTADPSLLSGPAQALAALLSTAPPPQGPSRAASLIGAGTGHPLTALPFLITAAQPLPCRLSTPQLVELLKMPGCVGAGRRVVLDHLGNRYRRHFADVWEFVRFAKEQNLGLDFTSPPKRPEAPPTATKP
jgi:hypothetical protein